MQKRIFSLEYKLEAVKLVKERGSLLRRLLVILLSSRMSCANGFGKAATIPASRFLEKAR